MNDVTPTSWWNSRLGAHIRDVDFLAGAAANPMAKALLIVAGQHGAAATRNMPLNFTIDPVEAGKAISELTSALKLCGNDNGSQIGMLFTRSELYSLLGMPDQALADAQAARELGALDRSEIVSLEAFALLERGLKRKGPEDLESAARLFTMAMDLPPSTAIASKSDLILTDRIMLSANRARAYYGLHQYEAAMEDCKHVLELLRVPGQRAEFVRYGLRLQYLMIIACYIHMGDLERALNAASEWEHQSSGEPAAATLVQRLRSSSFDMQALLTNVDSLVGLGH
jgi:tetratricopeptide (TPR) repeat protein